MNKTVFKEDLDNHQLLITRKFNGPVDLVWRAWTESKLLDKWWAPTPWKSITKAMSFTEGGHRLYCMQGPKGEQHWGKTTYLKIELEKFFEAEDTFCDEEGSINQDIPGSHWEVEFHKVANGTEVRAMNTFSSREAMQQLISMGIKEGTLAVHENLELLMDELKA